MFIYLKEQHSPAAAALRLFSSSSFPPRFTVPLFFFLHSPNFVCVLSFSEKSSSEWAGWCFSSLECCVLAGSSEKKMAEYIRVETNKRYRKKLMKKPEKEERKINIFFFLLSCPFSSPVSPSVLERRLGTYEKIEYIDIPTLEYNFFSLHTRYSSSWPLSLVSHLSITQRHAASYSMDVSRLSLFSLPSLLLSLLVHVHYTFRFHVSYHPIKIKSRSRNWLLDLEFTIYIGIEEKCAPLEKGCKFHETKQKLVSYRAAHLTGAVMLWAQKHRTAKAYADDEHSVMLFFFAEHSKVPWYFHLFLLLFLELYMWALAVAATHPCLFNFCCR